MWLHQRLTTGGPIRVAQSTESRRRMLVDRIRRWSQDCTSYFPQTSALSNSDREMKTRSCSTANDSSCGPAGGISTGLPGHSSEKDSKCSDELGASWIMRAQDQNLRAPRSLLKRMTLERSLNINLLNPRTRLETTPKAAGFKTTKWPKRLWKRPQCTEWGPPKPAGSNCHSRCSQDQKASLKNSG